NTNRDTQVGSSGGWFLSSAMCVFLFQVENLESREMWKGFILTVVELKVPSSLTLLPGHIYMMSEALDKEQERRSKLAFSSPSCFYKVSRTEAQVLLEKNEDSGNMLLRPGGDGKSVSVTTRQVAQVCPTHERGLSRSFSNFQYRCSSLAGVVDYFVSNTNKALVPLCLDESYAGTLGGLSARRSASVPAAGRGRGKGHVGMGEGDQGCVCT
uniref:Signal transducing adaptor family member 2 n=1 Tax=Sphenodon punctatus TaxID=8508 RepID=A0A8D0H4H0_SPHPU